MSTRKMYFKVTKIGRRPTAGNQTFQWPCPYNREPGKWAPFVQDPQMCATGYHLTDVHGLYAWLPYQDMKGGDRRQLWVAEPRLYVGRSMNKTLWRQARLLYQVHEDLIEEFVQPRLEVIFGQAGAYRRDARYIPKQPLPLLKYVLSRSTSMKSEFEQAVRDGVWEDEAAA